MIFPWEEQNTAMEKPEPEAAISTLKGQKQGEAFKDEAEAYALKPSSSAPRINKDGLSPSLDRQLLGRHPCRSIVRVICGGFCARLWLGRVF